MCLLFTKRELFPAEKMCIRDRTDGVEAKLVTSNELPGGNVTGVSDAAPLEKQLEMIREFLPKAKKIGMIYKDVYKRQYVDRDDRGKGSNARIRKDSFYWYARVIASNGEDL